MRYYACIDLKSFYASVECVLRGLDPITTNLVVADISRTEKTICLAVSPSLKQYGISSRARLFEVVSKVREINNERKKKCKKFIGKSISDIELKSNDNLELDYIVATPRMSLYMKYSTEIYNVYLKYLSSDDIHVYSIDEIFCDITTYLNYYNCSPKELITKILIDIYNTTGITATAGIGTNLFLAKVAMDVVAKHIPEDSNGVRIATLDEAKYKKLLWNHTPITDFWRVGVGYAKKLEKNNIYTMGDIALTSINNEDLLFKLFGINAELLIDHAWGIEPCTIEDIKKYKPKNTCITKGQVLQCAYDYEKAKLIVKEMLESLSLELVEKHLITNQIVLVIGYDIENLNNTNLRKEFEEVAIDRYGRFIPKPATGRINIDYTSSTKKIVESSINLYERIVNDKLLIKRINVSLNNLLDESSLKKERYFQFDLFSDTKEVDKKNLNEQIDLKKELDLQHTMLDIMKKYGKNSILKAHDLKEEATTIDRNNQIGGHKA